MRKRRAIKRDVLPDPIYNSKVVTKLINAVMNDGKKGTATRIVNEAFDKIKEQTTKDPMEVFTKAMENITPALEVKSRRVGGSNVPKFNVKMMPGIKNGYRVLPQGMDQSVTPSNNPIGSFSAEDLLAPIFSKKAHIRKHNAKNANAWKTYKNALPVKDSPFSKKKPALKNSDSPKEDSLNIKTDSLKTDSLLYIKRDTLIVPKNNKPVNIVN